MSDFAHTGASRWPGLVVNRLIELVIVFVGVYAAFLLNNHQIHEQENQRRAQILAYLQRDNAKGFAGVQEAVVIYDHAMNEFLTALAAGKMPALEIVNYMSGYNPNDTGWIMEAGGLDLLDVDTIARLRDVDSLMRRGTAGWERYDKWVEDRVVPHLNEGVASFYDPATKKLRPALADYPEMLRQGSQFLHELIGARDRLDAQLRAEQKRLP